MATPTTLVATDEDDHRLAARLATEAGELLVDLRLRCLGRDVDPSQLRDEADHRSHEFLMDGLADRVAAGDAVLSEEGRDDPVRLERDRVWIVDPLDGTREFGEPGRADWAVHVALTIDGTVAAGAVALPALDLTLATRPVPPLPGPIPFNPRIVMSRTRPPEVATFLARRLGAELVEMGSAGAKAMSILRGESDLYVHAGGQYEWDSCAPVAVAAAAGLWCSRIDGSPMRYNRVDAYLPDLLICRRELAEAALDALAEFTPTE